MFWSHQRAAPRRGNLEGLEHRQAGWAPARGLSVSSEVPNRLLQPPSQLTEEMFSRPDEHRRGKSSTSKSKGVVDSDVNGMQ